MSKEIYVPKFPGSTGTGILPGFKQGGFGSAGGGVANAIPAQYLTFPTVHPNNDSTNWDKTTFSSAGITYNSTAITPPTSLIFNKYNPYTGGTAEAAGYPIPAVANSAFRVSMNESSKTWMYGYKGWNLAGLQFDVSKGIRVQVMAGDEEPWRIHHSIYIYDVSDPNNSIRMTNHADGFATRLVSEYVGGVRQDSNVAITGANNSTNTPNWHCYSLEIPPGGIGDAIMRYRQFTWPSGYGVDQSYTLPLGVDWTQHTLDGIAFGGYRHDHTNDKPKWINYAWVGTAADDWPV